MAKRIVLAVFAGITLLGLVLGVTGALLGGRPGSITVADDSFVFENSKERVVLGTAPRWMRNLNSRFSLMSFAHGEYDDYDDYDDYYEDEHGYARGHVPPAPEAPVPPEAPVAPVAPAAPGMSAREQVEIDISAGHVVVQAGSAFALEVDGPLTYTQYTEEGVWHIESEHDISDYDWDYDGHGYGNFFSRNGQDMTTTFTVTVPETLLDLNIEQEVGTLTVLGVTATNYDLDLEVGDMAVHDGSATNAAFSITAGTANITGFVADHCKLDADAGTMAYEGDIRTYCEVECDAASVDISVAQPAQYGYAASVSVGSITVGDETISMMDGSREYNPGATPFYDLECSVGSINVFFS